jgi:thiosulfate reductase cytochrome b subunit
MYTSHSYWTRLAHWLLAVSIAVLAASGLEIFAAFPSFGAKLPAGLMLHLPAQLRLGGWLGGALAWHFTFAWIFAAGLVLYFADLARGAWRRIWITGPEWTGILPMVRHYALRGPRPEATALYNPLQKLAYLTMSGAFVVSLLTGLMLLQPVRAGFLLKATWAWQAVRLLHFGALAAFAGFLPGHLVMVALSGRTAMRAMTTGRSEIPLLPRIGGAE